MGSQTLLHTAQSRLEMPLGNRPQPVRRVGRRMQQWEALGVEPQLASQELDDWLSGL